MVISLTRSAIFIHKPNMTPMLLAQTDAGMASGTWPMVMELSPKFESCDLEPKVTNLEHEVSIIHLYHLPRPLPQNSACCPV